MSLPSDVSKAFAGSILFQNLSDSTLEAVYQAGWRTQVGPKGFFYHQGDPATSTYLLLEGRAKLTQLTPDGHQVLVRFLDPGRCFGIAALADRAEYPAALQAVDACSALGWEKNTLRDLLQRYPQIALNALQVMVEQCQGWQRRYHEVTTECVEQRVAQTLLRLARQAGQRVETGVLINLPLSREDLAEMTGTTQFTASRVLNRWEHQGLVELGWKRIVILQMHGLVAISEGLTTQKNSNRGDR
ncbi:MAG: Crp/Fnr family transcriptional regulator [Chloroflexota bacterium]|nr:Crp/Fnr family transcriptional regulator [Chloroflexota bacterium]